MTDRYISPLTERYSSRKMQQIFSADYKFKTWRLLWIALAEAQQELGLAITAEQIAQMKSHLTDIPYAAVREYEKRMRHDVMAHVHAYGDQCPKARGIIHWGATSCYVTDNTDLITMREGLILLRQRLLTTIAALADFAEKTKDWPTLGYTHFQPAQPVTVGKRASLWLYDLILDLEDLDHILNDLPFLGSKGTTGTQASFLEILEDEAKVLQLDQIITAKMGFKRTVPVSGQTYTRKIDSRIVAVLSGIAQSAHKFSNDIRLLQHLKELEEPFGTEQIGSSAMAYKRNPMRSERIAGLARHLISNSLNPALTAAEQWLERTLDDSSNKRLAIPEAFLSADAILLLYQSIVTGINVYPHRIEQNLRRSLPFMATEEILMAQVKKGGDRQLLHEKIRRYSMQATRSLQETCEPCDLIDMIRRDPDFDLDQKTLDQLTAPENYVGRAPAQVTAFLDEVVRPLLAENPPLKPEEDPQI